MSLEGGFGPKKIITQEGNTEEHINELRRLVTESENLQKNPNLLSKNWDGIEGLDFYDKGEEQQKKINEMVASGKVSAEQVSNIKNDVVNEILRGEQTEKDKKLEDLTKIKEIFEKFDLSLGKKLTVKGLYGNPATAEIIDFDKDKGIIEIAELDERGFPKVNSFYSPENFEDLNEYILS